MTAEQPALEFRLPGEWWEVPLGSQAEAAESIRALVRREYGRRDEDAAVRAEHRRRLTDAAGRAISAGATQQHIALRMASRATLATTLIEYRPALPLGDRAEPALVAEGLVAGLFGGTAGADSDRLWSDFAADGGVAFEKGDSIVLRRSRRIASGTGGDEAEALQVDYWLTEPGRAAAVLVGFSTILVDAGPMMIELFDAIIAAADWRSAGRTGDLRAELASG
ncbi:hypothetical protein [Agromyces sp. NPDC058104]|uniref:hypothetical protein n=1 Tax=Agromyces sp. NPDC058104 TaxID=3346342 RepID=UPI0036D99DE1